MLKLEQGLHHKGWDRSPGLYSILRDRGRLRLREHPVPWNGPPGAILEAIADQVCKPTQWGELLAFTMAAVEGFHGLLFAHEGWFNTMPPEERDNRRLADIVGSKEMRGVYAVTTEAKVYYVIRIRGEKPQLNVISGDLQLGGRVADALVRIVKAVAALMPDEAVDRAALDALKLPTEEEADR